MQQKTNNQIHVPAIRFKAAPVTIGSWTILKLPASASAQLPSRGQVMVEGSINGLRFQTALEPDGNFGHWFRVDKTLRDTAGVKAGNTATLEIEPSKKWPEPEVPEDLQKALAAAPQAYALWEKITPMARWEWIRWIRATGRQETRAKRIDVGISKLISGERRPCCWNRNLCTEPSVSENGVLLGATQT